jgi:hypothetical protein
MRRYGLVLTRLQSGHYVVEGTDLLIRKLPVRAQPMPAGWAEFWALEQRSLPGRYLVTGYALYNVIAKMALLRDTLASTMTCPVKGAACAMFAEVARVEEVDE